MPAYLKIENIGVCPPEGFTVLGVSLADTSDNQGVIGQFGSGNKHAAAVCLRNNVSPVVFCGTLRLDFFTKPQTVADSKASKDFARVNEATGEEKEEKRFFLREYTVFNVAQCAGEALNRFRPTVRPAREFIDFQPAQEVIAATGAEIRHGGNRAFFNRAGDYIQLPLKGAFDHEAGYYAAALHELAHWTGHESRLNRLDKLARFGDMSYQLALAVRAGHLFSGQARISSDQPVAVRT